MTPYEISLALEQIADFVLKNYNIVYPASNEMDKLRNRKRVEEIMDKLRVFVSDQMKDPEYLAKYNNAYDFIFDSYDFMAELEKDDHE